VIIDKKGKLFGKINIIDLCVAIFVILAVAVAVFKFSATPGSTSHESKTVIEYTLKVTEVRDYTVNQFKIGDNIYDEESGKCIGKITGVKKEDAKAVGLKMDGTHTETTKPERYDVIITVETEGTVNDTGYFAAGTKQISSNSSIIISNKRFETTSTVLTVGIKK